MKKIAIIWLIVLIILIATSVLGTVIANYRYETDLGGYYVRACTAANAKLMNSHLGEVEQAFRDKGWTTGYTVYVFKTPENDLSLIFEQLLDFRARLTSISEMDVQSFEYQKALEEVTDALLMWGRSFNLGHKFYLFLLWNILGTIAGIWGFGVGLTLLIIAMMLDS